ncbi:MAG TPA: hypothetical protein VK766_02915 [Cytophagaceae bacterium]|jgi:hypothetical protein|nr:hypothetical protein [Cytophagaceae bacterium]
MATNIIWLNADYYTPFQLCLFGIGALLWIVNYVVIVRTIIKHKFVEMPAAVLCANFTWEFLWAWIFTQNMGFAIGLGYKLWFFLDIFIIIGFYRYGYKQVSTSVVPYYKLLFTFAILSWLTVLYFFIQEGMDNPIGANSAYIINLLISSLYLFMFLRLEDKSVLSFTAAWTKWAGTGFISLMCILRWPENRWLITMCIACFLMDLFYMYLFIQYKRQLAKG